MLWLAILITIVASTACSIGKALQKEATRHLPKLSLESKILRQYVHSRVWLSGVAADLSGGILQIAAFALAPVSIVQPISSVGLVGLALYSHFYLRERLSQWEWGAVIIAGIGTLGLGASSGTESSSSEVEAGPLRMFLILLITAAAVASLTAVRNKQRIRQKRQGSEKSAEKSAAALYGLQAGGCFGLSAASCRIGFLMAGRSGNRLWGVVGLLGSVCLSSAGFVVQTRGLKEGSAVVVVTCVVVSSMGAGVLVGVLGLAEPFPTAPVTLTVHMLSIFAILLGVTALSLGVQGVKELLAVVLGYVPASVWGKLPVNVAVKLKSLTVVKDSIPQHHLHVESPNNDDGNNNNREKQGSMHRSSN